MRILLLNDRIPPEGRGGAESVVWRLARGLAAAGHDARVIATAPNASFEEERAGIPTYHIRAGYPERFRAWLSLWNPQTVGAFQSLLRRLKPDVVNAHNIHRLLSYQTLTLARAAGCGVVFSAHDAMTFAYGKLRHFARYDEINLPADYRLPPGYNLRQNRFRYNPFRNMIIKRCLERQPHVRTAPSQALADALAVNDMPPVEVVHNGIETAEWAAVDASLIGEMRRRLGLEGKHVILIAGRLTAEKGTRQILSALERLREPFPQLRLLVLTARDIESQIGPEHAHLRQLVAIGGWLSGAELRAAYQLADVVIAPSVVFDTFPTVLLEAMAAGKPAVATRFGGASEIVVEGETGFIVNPLEIKVLTDRLARLLGDGELRREMGRRGRERVRTRFSLERQVTEMLEIYQRAAAMAAAEERA